MISCVKFGKALLKTKDLDPIYIIANQNTLPKTQLQRFLLAYWFFYHAGVASYLSEKEGERFFIKALHLAEGTRAPRGTERRHFRGDKASVALQKFMSRYKEPQNAIAELLDRKRTSGAVIDFVQGRWPQFGPWIGFKVADMVDRCLGIPLRFTVEGLRLYDSPKKGADELAQSKHIKLPTTDQQVSWAVEYLIKRLRKYKAPPFYDRPVALQEVETVLCKWHSCRGGHYWVGKDIQEIRHALMWRPTKTSENLLKLMPKEVKRVEET